MEVMLETDKGRVFEGDLLVTFVSVMEESFVSSKKSYSRDLNTSKRILSRKKKRVVMTSFSSETLKLFAYYLNTEK